MQRKFGLGMIVLIMIGMTFVGMEFWTEEAEGLPLVVDNTSGSGYTTIQAAVNAAVQGDQIWVLNGPYMETVTITTRGITIIGMGGQIQVMPSPMGGTVFDIQADWVNISNFEIIGTQPVFGSIGVEMSNAQNCLVAGCYIHSHTSGIRMNGASFNSITDNTINFNTAKGIDGRTQSDSNTIRGNTIHNNTDNIEIAQSSDNVIDNNRIFNATETGIYLGGSCPRTAVEKNNISANLQQGIYAYSSDACYYGNNTIFNNGDFGIINSVCDHVTIEYNEFSKNVNSIYSVSSSWSLVKNNSIDLDIYPLYCSGTSSSRYLDNEMTNVTNWATYLYRCVNETFSGNNMTKSGFLIQGDNVRYWNTHHIDADNKVNSKPVRYSADSFMAVIPSGAGQVILGNCTGAMISGQVLREAAAGICMGYCDGTSITETNVSKNYFGIYSYRCTDSAIDRLSAHGCRPTGIYLEKSRMTRIENSTFSENSYGIRVEASSNNTIKNTEMYKHSFYGAYLIADSEATSDNNTVYNCSIEENLHGIVIQSANNNTIKECRFRDDQDHGILVNEHPSYGPSLGTMIFDNVFMLSGTSGIRIEKECTGSMVMNNTISDSSNHGIEIRADNTSILNNTVKNATQFGMYISHSNGSILKGGIATDNHYGIWSSNCNGSLITDMDLMDNEFGVLTTSSTNTSFSTCRFFNNTKGLVMEHSSNITVFDNLFMNNTINTDESHCENITYNISKQPGRNIIGGDYLGGNYWDDYTGLDLDGDWLGDIDVPHGPGDHLPLQYDLVPPVMTDTTEGIPTTADPFNVTLNATDERVEVHCYIEYWFGTGPHMNLSMITADDGTFFFEVRVPANSTDMLHYILRAVDGSGNWNSTMQADLQVVDDDVPVIGAVSRPSSVLMGQEIGISVTVLDNIGVDDVYISYQCVCGKHENGSMNHLGGDLYNYTIPGQMMVGTVGFTIWVDDNEGNSFRSPLHEVQVTEVFSPYCSIENPANGSMIKGILSILLNASDLHSYVSNAIFRIENDTEEFTLFSGTPDNETFEVEWNTLEFADGKWTLLFEVTDGFGNINSTHVEVIIDNTPPSADAGSDTDVLTGTTVDFDGSGSSDANGIISYGWSFEYNGSVREISGPTPSFTFEAEGTYTVTLNVSDPLGNWDTDTVMVTVSEPVMPTVTGTEPEDGATEVPVDTGFVFIFSAPMEAQSLSGQISVDPTEAFNVSWNGMHTRMTVTFEDVLDHDTVYTLVVTGGTSSGGLELENVPFEASFRTEEEEVSSPTLIITSPTEGDELAAGSTFTVSGISSNLPDGTEVTVELDGETWTTVIDGSTGFWDVEITIPDAEKEYTLKVTSGELETSVTFDVKISEDEDDTGDNELDTTLMIFGVLILVLVIILIFFIMSKRSRGEDEYEDFDEFEDEE